LKPWSTARILVFSDLSKELVKQRERTLNLIADKDAELENLKDNFEPRLNGHSNYNHENLQNEKNAQSSSDENIPVTRMNLQSGEKTMVYYSQQMAYKDVEISKLRKLRTDLGNEIKQLSEDNSIDTESYTKQISLLKSEVERLKLNIKRTETTENLEYIKNVLFRFLTTKDVNVRISLINAITQILHFTKNEKIKVMSMNS